jgi:HEPN domain-containing protein
MSKSFVTESADELLYIAESDIMTYNELLAGTYYPPDRKYNIIIFHATMAVEKFLKSYIISNNKNIEQTHDLDYLCESLLNIDSSFEKIKENCALMNTFVPRLKYSNKIPITKQDMDKIANSLAIISNFTPIKAMRKLFSEKHKYEIVASIITSHSKQAINDMTVKHEKKKTSTDYDIDR